ncbi:hypothetical protein AD948_09885 [Acetobacter senegalensis]|uniref:Uncharacterized protein n=1 Tax=Acetobacter senegalensis TaxID=446692 RepID=A0A149U0L6_9PROT|nr:hypothetical protein AD948_09885 [Acetobacter senegalensis]
MVAEVDPGSAPGFKSMVLTAFALCLIFSVSGRFLTKTVLPTVAAAIHISNGIYLRNNSKGCLGCGCSVAG